MKRLVFHADPQHVLREGGEDITGGSEFEVTNDRALELLTDPALNIYEAPDSDLADLTRSELDDRARQAGLDPDQYRTKAEVIDALSAPPVNEGAVNVTDPGIHPQPDADGGEAPDNDPTLQEG